MATTNKHEIKVTDAVFYKQILRTGNLIKPATVVQIAGNRATIQFQETRRKQLSPKRSRGRGE